MDGSYGRQLADSLLFTLGVFVVLAFLLGYGCDHGCSYLRTHYTVEIKRTP